MRNWLPGAVCGQIGNSCLFRKMSIPPESVTLDYFKAQQSGFLTLDAWNPRRTRTTLRTSCGIRRRSSGPRSPPWERRSPRCWRCWARPWPSWRRSGGRRCCRPRRFPPEPCRWRPARRPCPRRCGMPWEGIRSMEMKFYAKGWSDLNQLCSSRQYVKPRITEVF